MDAFMECCIQSVSWVGSFDTRYRILVLPKEVNLSSRDSKLFFFGNAQLKYHL